MRISKVERESGEERPPAGWRGRLFAGVAAVPVWAVLAFAGWIVVTLAYSLVVPEDGPRFVAHPNAEVLDFSPASGPMRPAPEAPR